MCQTTACVVLLSLAAAPVVDEGPGVHPNVVQELVLADARKIAKADALAHSAYLAQKKRGDVSYDFEPAAPYQRYFRITSGRTFRPFFLVVFCVHLNKLSTRKKFKWPVFVGEDVLRIDVRDYGWEDRGKKGDNVLLVYERTAKFDPTFHVQAVAKEATKEPVAWPGGFDPKEKRHYDRVVFTQHLKKGDRLARPAAWLDRKDADELRGILYTESPILDAEWFLGQTCRQQSIYGVDEPTIGYYDFLALADRDAMFDLVGTSFDDAKKRLRASKGAILKSGVARHNRLAFRLGAQAEFVWGTFDTDNPKDRGILFDNLRDGEFLHQAEEYLFVLPNNLVGSLLCNDKGVRQATAPDRIIGSDRSKLLRDSDAKYGHNDTPVHANISCYRCHAEGDMLKDVDDGIRKAFDKGGPLLLTDPDKRVTRELEDEYLTDLKRQIARDRQLYSDAIKAVTTSRANPDGWTTSEFASRYSEAFDRYAYAGIDATEAARLLGVSRAQMLKGLKAWFLQRGQGDIVTGIWLKDDKAAISRTVFEQRYSLLMSVSLGLQPPETYEKGQPKPKGK